MVGKLAEICQSMHVCLLQALKVKVKNPSAASDGAIPHHAPLKEGTESEAEQRSLRQSQGMGWNGFSSARCCVPYGCITTELDANRGYFAGVLDGTLARAITAQSNKQKGGLKLHFCP